MDQFGYTSPGSGSRACNTKIPKWIFAISTVVSLIAVIIVLAAGSATTKQPAPMQKFAQSVRSENILKTLGRLSSIAAFNGNRAVGPGFDASLDYFSSVLLDSADCDVTTQAFGNPAFFEDQKPAVSIHSPSLNYSLQTSTDVITMTFGGNGTYDIPATTVFRANAFGCSATDFEGAKNKIALVFYNPNENVDCTAYDKALNAYHAGAVAILIANDASRHRLSASRLRGRGYSPGLYEFVQVPTLAISYMTATTILGLEGPATVSIKASTRIVIQQTRNLFCTTKGGDPEKLLVFGAHLDSVPAGPGINDNGSGASTLLEIAKQFKAMKLKVVNKVQFSWWGAEEPGLIGSRFFVNDTKVNNPAQWNRIKASLNFDTIASPNGIPQLYNIHLKNEANETFPQSGVSGSEAINALFVTRFNQLNRPYLEIAFEGGSDYYPFVQNGIPSGGLDGGAADVKTIDQAAEFGGLGNFVMDACYHEPCDDLTNVNVDMLMTMADAAAFTIGSLATEKDLVGFLAKGASKQD